MAPTPCTSAAGFDRVNVTQSRFSSDAAAKSLESTITISGHRASGWSSPIARQSRSASADHEAAPANRQIDSSSADSSRGRGSIAGPCTATTPGRQGSGAENPSGSDQPAGSSPGSVRTAGPRAATTSLEPAFSPLPE